MVVHYRTKGFVFKKEDRSESDRTFSVFTKDFGRIEIFGKAIRKITSKLRGNIEIFYLSEIEFIQGQNRKTLTDSLLIEKFKNISQTPEKLENAYRIANVLDNFIKGEEKDERIWHLIMNILQKLDNPQSIINNQELLYYYFIWNFISVLGYGPETSICAVCGQKLNPYSLYFSNKEGGVICKSCFIFKRDAIKIKSDIVKILRLILKKDWSILSKLKIEISSKRLLKEISDNYYLYLLHSHSLR